MKSFANALWVSCALGTAVPASGQEQEIQHVWRLRIDNDLLALRLRGSPPDYDYTHGTSLSFSTASAPHLLQQVVSTPDCASMTEAVSRCLTTSLGITQEIFTPRRDSTSPIPGERPYAGKLYLTATGNRIAYHDATSVRVELGVTGRPALAAGAQAAIHRALGNRPQVGWKHQLPSHAAIGLDLLTERQSDLRRTGSVHISAAGYVEGVVGNLRTAFRAGGSVEIEPSRQRNWRPDSLQRRHSAGWYGVLALQQEVVAADALITGGSNGAALRRHSSSIQCGFGFRRGRFGIEYRWTVRSPEYRAQPTPHAIGSLMGTLFAR